MLLLILKSEQTRLFLLYLRRQASEKRGNSRWRTIDINQWAIINRSSAHNTLLLLLYTRIARSIWCINWVHVSVLCVLSASCSPFIHSLGCWRSEVWPKKANKRDKWHSRSLRALNLLSKCSLCCGHNNNIIIIIIVRTHNQNTLQAECCCARYCAHESIYELVCVDWFGAKKLLNNKHSDTKSVINQAANDFFCFISIAAAYNWTKSGQKVVCKPL